MRQKEERIILTFNTTIDAITTEKYAEEIGIEGRLIPVPRILSASCGMAFSAPVSEAEKIENAVSLDKIKPSGNYRLII